MSFNLLCQIIIFEKVVLIKRISCVYLRLGFSKELFRRTAWRSWPVILYFFLFRIVALEKLPFVLLLMSNVVEQLFKLLNMPLLHNRIAARLFDVIDLLGRISAGLWLLKNLNVEHASLFFVCSRLASIVLLTFHRVYHF